jgi:toxin ParE1/3/4
MDRYTFTFEDAALEDIEAAVFWYESKSAGLGEHFEREVEIYLDRISLYPESYQLQKGFTNIRKIRLRRFPYYIFYVVLSDSLKIIGVLHVSRSDQFIHERFI